MPKQSTRRVLSAEDRFWPKVAQDAQCWEWNGQRDKDGYGKLRTCDQRCVRAHVYAWWLATGDWPDSGLSVCHTCDAPACVRNDDVGTYEIDGIAYPRVGHLWLGTTAVNNRDKALKGRAPTGDLSPSRVHRDLMPRGDRNGARLHPDRLARGDRNGARLHPDRLPRGDRNGSRLHPESRPRGEGHALSKLTADIVRDIRARHQAGAGRTALARELKVAKSTIDSILSRRTWKHV